MDPKGNSILPCPLLLRREKPPTRLQSFAPSRGRASAPQGERAKIAGAGNVTFSPWEKVATRAEAQTRWGRMRGPALGRRCENSIALDAPNVSAFAHRWRLKQPEVWRPLAWAPARRGKAKEETAAKKSVHSPLGLCHLPIASLGLLAMTFTTERSGIASSSPIASAMDGGGRVEEFARQSAGRQPTARSTRWHERWCAAAATAAA